jgi:hypothetical protein
MTKAKKTEDQVMPEAILVDEIQKYFGVEFNGDKAEFIREVTKESHRVAKEKSNHDPRKLAEIDEKVARLRHLWADDLNEDKLTDQQKELKKELKEKGYKIDVTFPDDESYMLSNGGKEDSGSMSAGIPAIVGIADRMVNPEGY